MKLLIANYHRIGDVMPPDAVTLNPSISSGVYDQNSKQILIQVIDVLAAFEIELEK